MQSYDGGFGLVPGSESHGTASCNLWCASCPTEFVISRGSFLSEFQNVIIQLSFFLVSYGYSLFVFVLVSQVEGHSVLLQLCAWWVSFKLTWHQIYKNHHQLMYACSWSGVFRLNSAQPYISAITIKICPLMWFIGLTCISKTGQTLYAVHQPVLNVSSLVDICINHSIFIYSWWRTAACSMTPHHPVVFKISLV